MVAEVEKYVNSIVPVDSDKASTVIDGVFQSVDSAMQNNGNAQVGEGILTTYGTDVTGSSSGGSDFNYLDDLLNGVYETDEFGNIITTTAFADTFATSPTIPFSFTLTFSPAVEGVVVVGLFSDFTDALHL